MKASCQTTTRNNRLNSLLFATLCSLLLLSSCTTSDVYNAHSDIPHTGWEARNVQVFTFDIPDRTAYDVNLFLRHENEYKYRNLWLFIKHISPDSICTTDTVNCILADTYGHWYGGGWGSYYQYSQTLKLKQPLDSGTHTLEITQAMRERNLKGISNIGVQVKAAQVDAQE